MVRKETDPSRRQVFIPGFFSWANTVQFGKNVGATPGWEEK